MTRNPSLLRTPCGLKQLVTPPLRPCRLGVAPPRATHATRKRLGGYGLYCTLSARPEQSHQIRIQRFGGWVILFLVSSKYFHTSLLILLRRHRINARLPIYNEHVRLQTRWVSDRREDETTESGTTVEKDGHTRYVAKNDAASAEAPKPDLLLYLLTHPLLPHTTALPQTPQSNLGRPSSPPLQPTKTSTPSPTSSPSPVSSPLRALATCSYRTSTSPRSPSSSTRASPTSSTAGSPAATTPRPSSARSSTPWPTRRS